jgi:hypothetical protein
MPQGKCKLCWEDRELQDSHLLPAAVYKMCRAQSDESPDPIGIRNDPKIKAFRVFQTSKQITGHVLCFSCEQILNAKGEDWLLPQLSTLQGFPLYDKITTIEPAAIDGDLSAYESVRVPDIQMNSLIHFGMGIFWKAAVHDWQTGHGTLRLEFGPYRDEIRTFLLGGPFPKHAYLMMNVVPPTFPTISLYVPFRSKKVKVAFYSFYVPGIEFTLALSRTTPDYLRALCVAHNPVRPITVSASTAQFIGLRYAEALQGGHIPPKLAERLQRIRGKKKS